MVVIVVVAVVVAAGLGATGALALVRRQRVSAGALVEELRRAVEVQRAEGEAQRDAALKAALDHLVTTGKAVIDAERELGARDLEGKKSLIDQQLQAMTAELGKVSGLVRELEAERASKLGELSSVLRQQTDGLASLTETTNSLRQALSSTKARGQWGERMAEDVLRLAGFVENVNYRKQRAVEGRAGVPDFTFLLPQDLALHMDVKFPLDNYLRYLEAGSDLERRRYRDDFLRDVRGRVRELAARPYVDPGGSTVDCMLLFIPNEQLYAFMHEQDGALLDEALSRKIVFCSPLTLFAVLAVVRQSVENFRLERTSDQILALLGAFTKQWEEFVGQMDKLGRRIADTSKEFDTLVGTRRRMLERQLDKVDALRSERALGEAGEGGVLDLGTPRALEA